MTETGIHKNHTAGGLIQAFMITLPYLALNVLIHLNFSGGSLMSTAAALVSIIFLSAMLFLMVYTNKTERYRTILFIVVGLSFILSFAAGFYEEHGRFMVFTEGDVVAGNVSYCPIAIPNTIAAIILGRILTFPSGVGGALMMLLIVAGVMIFGGRSWCGWHCFFAGIEEGMSRCRKKPLLKKKLNRKWIYFSFAILLIVTIVSPILLSPLYCDWMCPLKAFTEYEEISSFAVLLKAIIFVSLFLLLVILVPLITARRGQCAFFCPFGALLSFANKISPFEIAIDRDKCNGCKKCINACPTYAIDEESLKKGRTCINCYKCGRCIDSCPQNAISYHIKGTKIGMKSNAARMLFLYPTMILISLIGGTMISDAVRRLLLLMTTGSLVG